MMSSLSDLRLDHGPDGATALFSVDNLNRYMLERVIDPAIATRMVACGLNPSTADAFQDDPTVRREINFARSWGLGRLVKVNAYSWRDTKPADMFRAEREWAAQHGRWAARQRIVGVSNDLAITTALSMLKRDGGIALACWGANATPDRAAELARIAALVGVQWMCLGLNKDGSPKHPLYVNGKAQPRPWGLP